MNPVGSVCRRSPAMAQAPVVSGVLPRSATPAPRRISVAPPARYHACGPRLRHASHSTVVLARPPGWFDFSRTVTECPLLATSAAAVKPARPPPTMTTSARAVGSASSSPECTLTCPHHKPGASSLYSRCSPEYSSDVDDYASMRAKRTTAPAACHGDPDAPVHCFVPRGF